MASWTASAWTSTAKQARYARLLRDLPAGLSEWAVHPALGDQQAQTIDPGWRVRKTDYEFLTSPQAHAVLRDERITVISYRHIQQAWSRAEKPGYLRQDPAGISANLANT
jgi:hypothetical protein